VKVPRPLRRAPCERGGDPPARRDGGEATLTGLREQVAQAEAKLAQAAATLELLAQRASLLDEQHARVQADIERLKQEQQESTDHLADSAPASRS